jgi:hypothetical protein
VSNIHGRHASGSSVTQQRCLRLAVPIALTAVLFGCREANAPTPDIPPRPAAFAPQFPQPRPLPPEERATRVRPLDSKNCAATDTTYIDHTIAEVLARCVATGRTTRVVLTVVSRATDPGEYLQAMLQRFCGEVIEATGPEDWKVTVKRVSEHGGVAGEVTWQSPASAGTGQPTARRISDFSVTLQGEWRTGLGHYLAFTNRIGPVAMSPHDCPYTDR